ncbi:MAG: UDP-N-acetylmuramate--L-alanine ligase [Elusimicrobiota bacterium]
MKKIYFIGIGGIGMSGLAVIAKEKGYSVSGSDISENYITEKLKKEGIKIFLKHDPKNITKDIDLVVISSAIKDDNPELIKAWRYNIPVVKRAKFLSMLCENSKTVAVAGTHGKTTTTGMISSIFETKKENYTAVIGGISKHIGSNVKFKSGEYFIIEADESDGSFLYYSPLIAAVTNIDDDHLDFYKNIENIKKTFVNFINKIPFYGKAVLCGDDKNIKSILNLITSPYYTYGFGDKNDWKIKNMENSSEGISYEIYYKDKKEDKIKLKVFGSHNALNSLAAYVTARYLGVEKKTILEGLYNFKGMKRRLDLISKAGEVCFYDDYAHHPTEIKTTLSSLKSFYPRNRIIAIFQPHRYTRTAFLYKEFSKSFDDASAVYLTDIYPAGEKPIKGVSSELIINEINKRGKKAFKFKNAFDFAKSIKDNDIVIGLGAGDIYKILNEIKFKYETIIK